MEDYGPMQIYLQRGCLAVDTSMNIKELNLFGVAHQKQ